MNKIKPLVSNALSSAESDNPWQYGKFFYRNFWDLNPGLLGAKRECYPLCNAPPPIIYWYKETVIATFSLNKLRVSEALLISGSFPPFCWQASFA